MRCIGTPPVTRVSVLQSILPGTCRDFSSLTLPHVILFVLDVLCVRVTVGSWQCPNTLYDLLMVCDCFRFFLLSLRRPLAVVLAGVLLRWSGLLVGLFLRGTPSSGPSITHANWSRELHALSLSCCICI